MPSKQQAALRAVPMPLFATMGSIEEAINMASSQLPLVNKNTLMSVLFTYHNSLLLTQLKEKSWA